MHGSDLTRRVKRAIFGRRTQRIVNPLGLSLGIALLIWFAIGILTH